MNIVLLNHGEKFVVFSIIEVAMWLNTVIHWKRRLVPERIFTVSAKCIL